MKMKRTRKTLRALVPRLLLGFLVTAFVWVQGLPQIMAATAKVVTVAGGVVNDGKPATSAALILPRFVALDKKGNLYIADYEHRIRKVNAKTNVITTIAGKGISGFSGDGGAAKTALLSYPVGIVFDEQGNLLFSDSGNNRIRKIDTKGIITTIAGTGAWGFDGDGGAATSASLAQPFGLALDEAGNLYICDQGNNRVRMVDTQGIITTVAGNGIAGYAGDGGPATLASLNFPYAAIVDNSGNLYIGDFNNFVVRKVDTQGTITTFAGNNADGCDGDGGPATSATIGGPGGFAIIAGALLISGGGCSKVRAVDLGTNIIVTVAGHGGGYDGDGNPPLSTKFRGQRGLLFDSTGSLLIVDRGNQRIRRLDSNTKLVNTIAGGFVGDGGKGTAASLGLPNGVSYDSITGALYIADTNHNRVRVLYPTGIIETVAGTGISGYSGDGGPATQARLNSPYAVATDRSGNLFIADEGGGVIRKVDSTGTITTFAWAETFGCLDSLVTDAAGNLYGADPCRYVIWKISADGSTTTAVAGVPDWYGFNSDGILATEAWLGAPMGLALDAKGNLYIADTDNSRVRMVNPITGLISTIAGTGECNFSGDGGPATAATLCWPYGVAADNKGNILIADYGYGHVRSVNKSGVIQTIAGTGVGGYNGNGLPATQTNLDTIVSLAVGSNGAVYVVDSLQSRVRKIK
jgi:sugar lactone lactonase YvrE